MANILTKGIAKIFGTKSDKDIKSVQPYVIKTNKVFSVAAINTGNKFSSDLFG